MGVLGREAGKHAARFHRGNVACPLTCVSKARETETQNRPTGGSPGAVFATRSGCVFNAEMEPLPSMVFTSALEPSRLHQMTSRPAAPSLGTLLRGAVTDPVTAGEAPSWAVRAGLDGPSDGSLHL